jgi:hypothetical protein
MARLPGVAALGPLALLALTTVADADALDTGKVIFPRGGALIESDPRGKQERELAALPEGARVRALRTDALGKVLLADLDGAWWWMKLNEPGEALLRLPCGDGPAQLAEDAACVVCRGKSGATTIVNLISGKTTAVDVPSATAQVTGMGLERRLVWADPNGVWMAMPAKPKEARKVAPEPPLRGFLPSPDGTRAAGVYADHVFQGARNKQPGEVLMTFALDGDGARRKAIQRGIPVAWSHDSQWLLVQDGSSACVMRAVGGDYKCWRGYTAASLSPDGRYALLLGNRRDEAKPDPKARKPVKGGKPDPRAKKPAKPPAKSAPPPPEEPPDAEPEGDEHGDGPAPPDVPVPAPSGPLSLYRASIDGAFTAAPQLVARIVDGGVVWVPRAP